MGAKEDLVSLAEANPDALGSAIGFWDPLGATGIDFWGLGEEGTIGYLRHAEIKHGRVAMGGFLGFCAQCLPAVKGPHAVEPYREGAGNPDGYVHYTKGGKPGFYPSITGQAFGQIPFDLYDPFKILPEQTAAEKERGLKAEVNNGRAAMLGLFAVLSESKGLVVPPLDFIEGFPKYSGNVMIPFSNDFSLFN